MPISDEMHEALRHACPLCAADPGTVCVTKFGRQLEWPHIRRRLLTREPTPPEQPKQALCCECGQLRTYKCEMRARSALGNVADLLERWERRMVGALKCAHCGEITMHALMWEAAGNWDERDQALALGDRPRNSAEAMLDLELLRREYHEAFKINWRNAFGTEYS